MTDSESHFVAFAGMERIAAGTLAEVALAVRRRRDAQPDANLLAFDRQSGRVADLDLRGSETEIAARYAPETGPARRGRPRLGVTAREVTLLPRHWDWLARQPGGASVTLRRLVEAAAKAEAPAGDTRARIEAAYRFMSAMAGDMPGFEEASRALFAGDRAGLAARLAAWPADIAAEVLLILGAP